MNYSKKDIDETVRLILMDDKPPSGLLALVVRVRDVHPGVKGADIADLWVKYMGMDGRRGPTHDFMTGERLPR